MIHGGTTPILYSGPLTIVVNGINQNAISSTLGVVRLAIDAEALAGLDQTSAVTPVGLGAVLQGLKLISFDGRDGAGVCTAAGVVVGDKVLYVVGLTEGALGNATASFEATVTVVDQVQQSAAGNLSANNYLAVLLAVA